MVILLRSSMRRNLARSNGAVRKPIILSNRREFSPPKKSMFSKLSNASCAIDAFTPEPKPIWMPVPRRLSFQHPRPMPQCMYAVSISMNINPTRTSCVYCFQLCLDGNLMVRYLLRSQTRPAPRMLLHLLPKSYMTSTVSKRA